LLPFLVGPFISGFPISFMGTLMHAHMKCTHAWSQTHCFFPAFISFEHCTKHFCSILYRRERVKRRRAQAAKAAALTPPEAPTDENKQPDLEELSKGLPSGWQVSLESYLHT
jgi:hypothetical protein